MPRPIRILLVEVAMTVALTTALLEWYPSESQKLWKPNASASLASSSVSAMEVVPSIPTPKFAKLSTAVINRIPKMCRRIGNAHQTAIKNQSCMISIVVGADGVGSILSRRARFRPRIRSSCSEFRCAYLTIFPSSKPNGNVG